MLANQAQACNAVALLPAVHATDTAGATGSWVSIAAYTGDLAIIQNVGTVTAGKIAGKIRHADDNSGTNAADVTGATFPDVTTSNDPLTQKIVVHADSLKPYIQYVGTVTTGPADVSACFMGHPQYTA